MHKYFPLLSQFCTCAARLCDIKALEAGARRIQEKYAKESLVPLEGVAEHVAYIQCRMPATFAAVLQALRHLALVIPDFSPRSMIDLGSGPGTATLGAMVTFPTIADSVGYERSGEFCRLSEQLASLVPQIVR